jgi:conjugal transfer/entry exclusion protein
MAEAKRRMVELEAARQEEQVAELGVLREQIEARQLEAKQRAESADLAREVLGRFSQLPSAQQAAARLAETLAKQRGEG